MALQIALLEESFQQIAPVKEDFAKAFYKRLFSQSPHIQAFFINTDMQPQQNKLMASLALVISNLRQPDKLIETLQELGQRHETYHVQPEHYSLAETALLETFAQFLGAQ